ncbi:MAG: hypothetical protein ACFNUK_02445 [Schaalia sp.]|nr:hypothetical protein [Schaalia odontolytica]
MRDPIMTVVGPLVFGVVGFGVWYASMFVDNQFADVLRRESRKGWFWRNVEAVCLPLFSVLMVLFAIAKLAEAMGAPEWFLFCMALLMLCLMVPGVSSFLPIKFPDRFYADWQYAKRHGLLEEGKTGKKSPQNSDSGGVDRHKGNGVTIRVASGWRQLSEEERGELGDLGQDESIRFIAVGKAIEGYVPNIVITETEVFSGKGDKEILDGSAGRLAEPHLGCRLIDDTVAPYPTAHTRLVTGVYALNDTSMTVSQLVWLTRHRNDGDEEPHRFLWTATCTCPSLACPPIIEDFMTMARTLEVES